MKRNMRAVRGKLAESLDYEDRHWLSNMLREAEDDAAPPPGEDMSPSLLQHDSVDAVIDDQIMDAAKEAMGRAKNESRKRSLRELLEAEGDEEKAPDTGSPVVQKPPINVRVFAGELARIVQHATQMFDVEGVALRRGLNYLTKNHGKDAMEQVKDILLQDYEISLERDENEDNIHSIDFNAVGAGPEID